MKTINADEISESEFQIVFDVDKAKSQGYVYEILKKEAEAHIESDEVAEYVPPVLILRKRKIITT